MVLAAAGAGLLLSFAALALLRPALPPPWRWQARGIAVHAGLWCLAQALLTLMLGRPWFAMALALALVMLIVQVSNAKFHSLREPFVFQDFEYFTDAIRHPRLYIPFLGWWKFAAIAAAVLAALVVGLWLEPAAAGRFALDGQLAEVLLLAGGGLGLLMAFGRGGSPSYEPGPDMARTGLLASLWDYALAERQPLMLPATTWAGVTLPAERPDFVVVQSESFFDARRLFPGIRPEVLGEFDGLRREALAWGQLHVPAWGANTVRSEFAFLSGAAAEQLGVHRFNPYRQLLRGEVATAVAVLKAAGYRTVCIHPYPASFYGRDRIYPHLGFDEFIDIGAFATAERYGPYVADRALAAQVEAMLASAQQPLFVFVITMENHGPLHLEKADAADHPALYSQAPPAGCDDLTVYLRHLRNADRMAGQLRRMLLAHPRPARLCWYGDHVPIMEQVYRCLGAPSGVTDYLIWSNRPVGTAAESTLPLHELAARLLAGGDSGMPDQSGERGGQAG
ncbi:MAG: capsular biosynthesis protein [Betaproteobacteria bacterium HGW-Betaproteobacteria-12]|nr:MAG: capsular biosynthesis protein [Betaproteobacteria bacterium HGW-Betaproteobacteria-12]